jgi:hypothetical protein
MTPKTKQALEMALNALETCTYDDCGDSEGAQYYDNDKVDAAHKLVIEALAEPEQIEPEHIRGFVTWEESRDEAGNLVIKVLPKTQVRLTDGEIDAIDANGEFWFDRNYQAFARAIESAVLEKNK